MENDLAQELLCRSCQGDLAQDLVHRNLQNLPGYLFVMFFATLFGVSCRDIVFTGSAVVPCFVRLNCELDTKAGALFVVSRCCLGGPLVLGGVSVVSWWCPCGVLQATAGVLLFVSVFMRLS